MAYCCARVVAHNGGMKTRIDFATLAGIVTWMMVYGISVYILQKRAPGVGWEVHLLFLTYGGLFWAMTRETGVCSLSGRFAPLWMLLQLVIAFSLLWILPPRNFEFLAILTIIWAAMLPSVTKTAVAIALTILVVALWHTILALKYGQSVWITGLLYGSFHVFAVLVQSATRDAETAQRALTQKHQQLLATQQLLQAASRQSERTRIARNLHDLVGHHLTALSIQLQIASHKTEGDAKQQIDKCSQLAKLLLADVREAVSTMRQFADVSLIDAVKPLTEWLPPSFSVRLDIADDIMLNDLQQGQDVIYIIQEAISNSLRHSSATAITISAAVIDECLVLTIYDNGKLPLHWVPGNGLIGMQERVRGLQGALTFEKRRKAMQISIRLPYRMSEHV